MKVSSDSIHNLNELYGEIAFTRNLDEKQIQHLQEALCHHDTDVKMLALKICRQCLAWDLVKPILKTGIEYVIVRILTADHSKYSEQRELCLKFIRTLLATNEGLNTCPKSILRTIVAIAEHSDDKLRNPCIETLCELAVTNPKIAFECNSLKLLFTLLVDGPKEILDAVVLTVLYIVDLEESRKYIRPSVELEIIASYFTDACGDKQSGNEERLSVCSRILCQLMKSWSGLLYLASGSPSTLQSIVLSLKMPLQGHKMLLIDTFYEIIQLSFEKTLPANDKRAHIQFIFHFKAMQMILFLEAGLLEALVEISSDSQFQDNIFKLLSEIFKYVSILPSEHSSKIQSLANFFYTSTDFSNSQRHISSSILLEFEHFSRDSEKSNFKYAKKQVNELKRFFNKSKENADENFLRGLLNETKVIELNTQYDNWNWDSIYGFLKTLSVNPKRTDEIVKGTKFFRKLLDFYRPLNQQFSDMKNIADKNQLLTQVLWEALNLLFQNPEGYKLIEEHRFFPELADCLMQAAQSSNQANAQVAPILFSKERLERSMSTEYFTILGKSLGSAIGVQVLEEYGIINILYSLALKKNRDDISMLLVSKLDCIAEGHGRIILSLLLAQGPKIVRKHIMGYLGHLSGGENLHWTIPMLVEQLYDVDRELSQYAVQILDNLCQREPKIANEIIRCRPVFVNVDNYSFDLQTRLLAVQSGYEFLSKLSLIEDYLLEWNIKGNYRFVTRMELFLEELIASNSYLLYPAKSKFMPYLAKLPAHFYGELCRTPEGCNLLKKKGYFTIVSKQIEAFSVSQAQEKLMEVKAALWAVGFICSSDTGLAFIRNAPNLLASINRISVESPNLSLKGTCFYVLGLISQTEGGSLLLTDLHWKVASNAKRYCFPTNDFFNVSTQPLETEPASELKSDPLDPSFEEVLLNVSNLSNQILSNASSKKLSKLRMTNPTLFQETALYYRVMKILENYHFRLPARKFIEDVLFDNLRFNQEVLSDLKDDSKMNVF